MQTEINFTTPANQNAKILWHIISGDGVNERQFNYNGFRRAISQIRAALLEENIVLRYAEKPFISEFGKANKFRHHFILDCDKPKALSIYNRINGNSEY